MPEDLVLLLLDGASSPRGARGLRATRRSGRKKKRAGRRRLLAHPLALGQDVGGLHGVIFWFIGGQASAYEFRRRAAEVSPMRRLERVR